MRGPVPEGSSVVCALLVGPPLGSPIMCAFRVSWPSSGFPSHVCCTSKVATVPHQRGLVWCLWCILGVSRGHKMCNLTYYLLQSIERRRALSWICARSTASQMQGASSSAASTRFALQFTFQNQMISVLKLKKLQKL